MSSALFSPIKVGHLTLSHRIIMAPMTRFRADENGVHHELAVEYYGQRANKGGLQITESTNISEEASGLPNMPGIWNGAQISGWKAVTDAVHAEGGLIYLQLAALGRVGNADYLGALGHKVVGPSHIPVAPGATVPEPLTKEDILRYVEAYVQAAKNGVEKAGFDGIEIHNANGCLLDQFIQTVSNDRDDEFGGSEENRARFTFLVTDAVTKAVGQDRVGIRFSPFSPEAGLGMTDPYPTYNYITRELRDRFPNLAYVSFIEPRLYAEQGQPLTEGNLVRSLDSFRTIWNENGERPFFSAGGYTVETAEETIKKHGGAVIFGRHFLANPDLPYRIKNNIPFNTYNRDTFYVAGRAGYVDYPFAADSTTETAAPL